MSDFKLVVPVVLCVFNRLDTTQKVLEKIREVQPQKLYVIADGARESVVGEKEKVDAVKKYIEMNIDWECEVLKNYASVNMGCGRRISSGLSWVFETEEQAIILEDDCVPEISFFQYCQEMLEYYKENEQIFLISGNNPIAHLYPTDYDYLFSHVPFMWGWATWKRAWKLYDFTIASWPSNKNNSLLRQAIPIRRAYWYYSAEFDAVYMGKCSDIWDYQFMYIGIVNAMFGIVPAKSHVQNIGFIEEATHTDKIPKWVTCEVSPVEFPIRHRKNVEWDRAFDERYMTLISKQGLAVKVKNLLGLDVNTSIFDMFKRK